MEVMIDGAFDESPKLTYRIRSRDPLNQVLEGEELVRGGDDTMEEEAHTTVGSEGDVPDTRSGTASKRRVKIMSDKHACALTCFKSTRETTLYYFGWKGTVHVIH